MSWHFVCLKCDKKIDHFGTCSECDKLLVGPVYQPARGELAELLESPDEYWMRMDYINATSGGHPNDHGDR